MKSFCASFGGFVRWTPVAIILWVFALISGLSAAFCGWLWKQSQDDAAFASNPAFRQFTPHVLFTGIFENLIMLVLCVAGWGFMRRKTEISLLSGSAAVMVALFISIRRWLYWDWNKGGFFGWAEPVLIWIPLVYTICYAYRKRHRIRGIQD